MKIESTLKENTPKTTMQQQQQQQARLEKMLQIIKLEQKFLNLNRMQLQKAESERKTKRTGKAKNLEEQLNNITKELDNYNKNNKVRNALKGISCK